jgi:hypothetical protein
VRSGKKNAVHPGVGVGHSRDWTRVVYWREQKIFTTLNYGDIIKTNMILSIFDVALCPLPQCISLCPHLVLVYVPVPMPASASLSPGLQAQGLMNGGLTVCPLQMPPFILASLLSCYLFLSLSLSLALFLSIRCRSTLRRSTARGGRWGWAAAVLAPGMGDPRHDKNEYLSIQCMLGMPRW